MPTPVILDMLTFLWPIGVNILERNSVNSHPLWPCQPHRQICQGRSRGSPHPTTEWCWLKKSRLSYHRISPADTFCRHFLGPTGDLFVLIWQPCVEKSSLQIQRYVLLLARNMIQEKSYLCFYLYHTTCRNRILPEKTTRKMERESYCELIWCLWIGLIFRNNMHL